MTDLQQLISGTIAISLTPQRHYQIARHWAEPEKVHFLEFLRQRQERALGILAKLLELAADPKMPGLQPELDSVRQMLTHITALDKPMPPNIPATMHAKINRLNAENNTVFYELGSGNNVDTPFVLTHEIEDIQPFLSTEMAAAASDLPVDSESMHAFFFHDFSSNDPVDERVFYKLYQGFLTQYFQSGVGNSQQDY